MPRPARDGPAPGDHTRDRDLRTAFDHAPIGIAVLTPDGVVIAANTALGELLDRHPDQLVGTTFFDVTHPEDLPAARRNCQLMQDGRTRIVRHECRFLRPDGSAVWVSVSTARVPELPDRAAHLIMHVEDTSERKALETRLSRMALHDPLTGLANRTLLDERIDEALDHPDPVPCCLLYLDLNGFKAVNDRFGHTVGDALLQALAARIQRLVGPHDTAARLGGDEFAVLCRAGDPGRPLELARRLQAAAARDFVIGGRTIRLSAAIGLATPDGDRSPPTRAALLAAADDRMYQAKRRVRESTAEHRQRPGGAR
jgi:diguanylate cyclase (GGDEF)-like protein/PAS domain S-box-containing protein